MSDDDVVDETQLGETIIEGARTVRVYGGPKGDFLITVPDGAKITFGYFNPAQSGASRYEGHSPNVAVQTALRIYERGEKGNQLACFIGVKGFRDERIRLTNLTQRVVIQTNFEDDGEGKTAFGQNTQRQIVATPEPDTYT